jgi:hypothetical protein
LERAPTVYEKAAERVFHAPGQQAGLQSALERIPMGSLHLLGILPMDQYTSLETLQPMLMDQCTALGRMPMDYYTLLETMSMDHDTFFE